MKRLVHGVGINDSNYQISRYEKINGKRVQVWICPFYLTWSNMLARCYSKIVQSKQPRYSSCSTVPEWHYFMTFKAWMEKQDWQGKHLDKDLLFHGNKVYGPETCLFISVKINSFLIENDINRGAYLIGVSFKEKRQKYLARCKQVTDGKLKHLGYFDSEQEAHQAWLTFKLEQAKILASHQNDERVAKALIERYENYVSIC